MTTADWDNPRIIALLDHVQVVQGDLDLAVEAMDGRDPLRLALVDPSDELIDRLRERSDHEFGEYPSQWLLRVILSGLAAEFGVSP